ncbi:MAG: DHA1 family inner membrane transport protein [Psychromonas sp.]|jgi:DHA1 family inner membrane transport protein
MQRIFHRSTCFKRTNGKLEPQACIAWCDGAFVASNILAWQAPRYERLITTHILTGLVSKNKAASAIAIMFMGLTIALGTYIGQTFGWQTPF